MAGEPESRSPIRSVGSVVRRGVGHCNAPILLTKLLLHFVNFLTVLPCCKRFAQI